MYYYMEDQGCGCSIMLNEVKSEVCPFELGLVEVKNGNIEEIKQYNCISERKEYA